MIPVAGFEAGTTRASGEVTLVFTTGRQTCSLNFFLADIPPGNLRTESRPIFSATLRFGATPPPRKSQRPGKVPQPCLLVWREVSLLFTTGEFPACGHTSALAPDGLSRHGQLARSSRARTPALHLQIFYGQGTGGHGRACALRFRTSQLVQRTSCLPEKYPWPITTGPE